METDLRTMHRLVTGPRGLTRLLGWLEQRLACRAILVDRDNARTPGSREPALPAQARAELVRVAQGRCDSVAVHTPTQAVRLVSMGQSAPILVLVSRDLASGDGELVSDAARLLALRWRVDHAAELERKIRQTENLIKESTLHLAMTGHTEQARRVLSAIGSPLHEHVRIYLVEGSFKEREELASRCELTMKGRACVIRCPVHRRHLIILAPTVNWVNDDGADDPVASLLRSVHSRVTIGTGSPVSVSALDFGYAEAFHALTLAREAPDRYVRLSRGDDLSTRTPPAALDWSRRVLSPLFQYVPDRSQDPNGAELLVTLRSWLDFRGGAHRQLMIHRNTLKARLDRIAALLGRDLEKIDNQAELHLALRLARKARSASGGEKQTADLAELLADESIVRWSTDFLRPLLSSPQAEIFCQTVRTWLAENGQIERTAAALGLSAPAVRKRLMRIEKLLGRSLLGAPSARFDLVLALRAWEARNVGTAGRRRLG